MQRKTLQVGGQTLSYLDNERAGPTLICLHGHFGCAAMFSFMQHVHDGRLLLLDQRGHGLSEHFPTYRTDDYVDDLAALIAHEQISDPALLGHSLGGINAYTFAARYGNVSRLIIEDIGTEVDCSNEWVLKLPREFATVLDVEQALAAIGMDFEPYFTESLRYDGLKWRYLFDYDGMVVSQRQMNGDHWPQWDAITCPILLLHGTKSWASNTANILAMKERNPNTSLLIYEGAGHTLHDECRERFCADVKNFIGN
ncbi:alpha/beta fold hydrolase [Niveibacterium terrae]|uniref:alpha/beta fold hydrolase n=1 Tax=Niveibacterium terrae TaxID=3373598 RepID=UPI003A93A6B5